MRFARQLAVGVVLQCVVLSLAFSSPNADGNWCQGEMPERSKYRFHPTVSTTFRGQFSVAAFNWTGIPNCEFEVANDPTDSPLIFGAGDGINTVSYSTILNSTLCAVTDCLFYGMRIVECDTTFNGHHSWSVHPSEGSNDCSMPGVATHELGHWVAVPHNRLPTSPMNFLNEEPGDHYYQLTSYETDGCRTRYPSGDGPWRHPPCRAGACCRGSNPCLYTDPATCIYNVGQFIEGQTCVEAYCPVPTGACCLPLEQGCAITTHDECAGSYVGDGTTCDGLTGACDPPATGACCFGSLCSVMTSEFCIDTGGAYRGDDTACPSDCPEGQEPEPVWPRPPLPCYPEACGELPVDPNPPGPPTQMTGKCPGQEGERGLNAPGLSADPENREYGPPAGCATCSEGLGTAILRTFRDGMLLSREGQRFVGIYYYYGHELSGIIRAHPEIRTLTGTTINDFLPAIRKYVFNDPAGEDFFLTESRLAQIETLVNAYRPHASESLNHALDMFMVDVHRVSGLRVSSAIRTLLGESGNGPPP